MSVKGIKKRVFNTIGYKLWVESRSDWVVHDDNISTQITSQECHYEHSTKTDLCYRLLEATKNQTKKLLNDKRQ